MGTRDTLMEAALACVADHGWEATTLAAVQARAGVSNGSLYHFFPRRDVLTAALIGAAAAERQDAYLALLHDSAGVADAVTAAVHEHLRWTRHNANLARLLYGIPPQSMASMVDEATVASHFAWWDEIEAWLCAQGWPGTPPLRVMRALWMGPTFDFVLGWLAMPELHDLDEAAEPLATAAWAAVAPLLTGR